VQEKRISEPHFTQSGAVLRPFGLFSGIVHQKKEHFENGKVLSD
jgi:hypothetical protein